MATINSRTVHPALWACLSGILCLAGCISDAPENEGIRFDQPVLGARETYVGFTFGGPKRPDTAKTYTRDSMSLEVVKVQGGSMTLSQKKCYARDSTCTTHLVIVNLSNGHVDFPEADGWSELETGNLFPSGLYADSSREIGFSGYVPNVGSPAVGIAPEYRMAGKSYRNVTVMVDPTGVPIDAGGRVLIFSREKRLLELYSYQVFGTDGGWEMRE